jgi:hypothetical protein
MIESVSRRELNRERTRSDLLDTVLTLSHEPARP